MNHIIQSFKSHSNVVVSALCLLASAYAYADNKAYVQDFSIVAGETKQVAVILDNSDPISSLSLDVTLPEGLEIVEGSALREPSRLVDKQAVSVDNPDGDQTWRLTVLEQNSNNIVGNTGVICYFQVKALDTFGEDGILRIKGNGSTWDSANKKVVSYVLPETTTKVTSMSFCISSPSKPVLRAGERATIEVSLTNTLPIAGLQASVGIPEGLKLVSQSDNVNDYYGYTQRTTNDSITVAGSASTVLISSIAPQTEGCRIEKGEGPVFTFIVEAEDNIQESSEIVLSNIILSKIDATKLTLDDLSITVLKEEVHITPSLPDSVEVLPGATASISFSLDNDVALCALQGVVTLPEGLSFAKDANGEYLGYGERMPSSSTITLPSDINDETRSLKFAISSTDNENFMGTSGVLFTINVKASNNWSAESGKVTVDALVASNPNTKKYVIAESATAVVVNGKASIEDNIKAVAPSTTIIQDVVELASGESKKISYNLSTPIELANLQVTVKLPEGLSIESTSENVAMKLVDGEVLLVVETVVPDKASPLFDITVKAGDKIADGAISFTGAKATVAGTEYTLPSSEVKVVKKTVQGLEGDVNGDGVVNALDLTRVLQIIKGK